MNAVAALLLLILLEGWGGWRWGFVRASVPVAHPRDRALAQAVPTAHQGPMNSPGHRAGGMFGLMATQGFRN